MKAFLCMQQALTYVRQNISMTVVSVIVLGVSSYVGCTEADFIPIPSECESTSGKAERMKNRNCKYSFEVPASGQADILFVNDNSGSMSTEQSKMAEAFGGFINSLQGLDYQIAMITTDVSVQDKGAPEHSAVRRKANGFGGWQNGQFLLFRNSYILSFDEGTAAERAEHQRLFERAVQRQETLDCENANYEVNKCPSRDERAIYATHLAFERNQRDADNTYFFRPKSHLAVVILSDEDERGFGRGHAERPLVDKDQPLNLVQQFNTQFNSNNEKSLSVHAIIVKPGDTACLQQQNAQLGDPNQHNANEGHVYKELVALTDGVLGDICANNYTEELGSIAEHIQTRAKRISLKCTPLANSLKVKIVQGSNTTNATPDQYTLTEASLSFENIPATASLQVSYICPGF